MPSLLRLHGCHEAIRIMSSSRERGFDCKLSPCSAVCAFYLLDNFLAVLINTRVMAQVCVCTPITSFASDPRLDFCFTGVARDIKFTLVYFSIDDSAVSPRVNEREREIEMSKTGCCGADPRERGVLVCSRSSTDRASRYRGFSCTPRPFQRKTSGFRMSMNVGMGVKCVRVKTCRCWHGTPRASLVDVQRVELKISILEC
ncbi:uncharacterized protein EDB93DRAFT_1119669 [Suillus bovinus]|uniref:uncharacterized protein n=1 Tax=Suillus bovinus TaxID=48563 RepID=UPI001B87A238|nr:uncharacterized protein EDB93DRAFT_1119669 [Suillus bovinus]KAG2158675.1 hypothetical protein EDB93DRAFT_1119669 [Suillus bovinus]